MYPFHTDIKYFINFISAKGCNFNCPECFFKEQQKTGPPDPRMTPENLRKKFSKFAPSVIFFNGGEPLLIHRLGDICRELSKDHLIGINTNTSLPAVIKDVVRGTKFSFVISSLHAEELNTKGKGEDYLESLSILKAHNVPVIVTWVTRLGKLDIVKPYIDRIQKIDYPVCARRYITTDTSQKINNINHPYLDTLRSWGVETFLFDPFVIGPIPENKFKKTNCRAGEAILDIFRDDPEGIYPCVYLTDKPVGNLWDETFTPQEGSRICTWRGGCTCVPYLLFDVTDDTHNLEKFKALVKPNLVWESV